MLRLPLPVWNGLLSVVFDLVLDLDLDLAQTTTREGHDDRSFDPSRTSERAPKAADNAILFTICHSDPRAAAPAARTGRNLLFARSVECLARRETLAPPWKSGSAA